MLDMMLGCVRLAKNAIGKLILFCYVFLMPKDVFIGQVISCQVLD